jgi:DNA invertase Pin-like site-specific DNA recombinase
MFDVYIRVSQLGERTEDEATEVYEADCREWAGRNEAAVDEVVDDTDVSGAAAVADRGLERLIQKVEAGESEGIITPYLDRFGRDLIEGALAYRRIRLVGGRLVCVRDGTDSDRPGDEMAFQMRMVIAEDYLRRVKANFQSKVAAAAERGVYMAARPPFGYRKDDEGRLVVQEAEAALVREMFRCRAAGASIGRDLLPMLQEAGIRMTKAGVAGILKNRAYLGELRAQSGVKGRPRVLSGKHEPVVTESEWQAAQAANGAYHPRPGVVARRAKLAGLVRCATCEKRLRTAPYGKDKDRVTYVCTNPDCTAHAGMTTGKLDAHVEHLLWLATFNREPHVAAIIEGDTRYTDALAAVERAQALHDELRDDAEAQAALGMRDWVAALRARKQALELARRELSRVRPPRARRGGGRMSYEEFREQHDRDWAARLIDRVVVRPAGRVGKAVPPVEERVDVYLAGAGEPYRPDYWEPSEVDRARLPAA